MRTVTASQIKGAFTGLGIECNHYIIDDELYAMVAPEWIDSTFKECLLAFTEQLRNTYMQEVWDCDDYALTARWYARVILRASVNNDDPYPIAFGDFRYIQNSGASHCLNVFIIRENGFLTPYFFEPQTGERVILTTKEITSCFGYCF
jgi:hypothetical protein